MTPAQLRGGRRVYVLAHAGPRFWLLTSGHRRYPQASPIRSLDHVRAFTAPHAAAYPQAERSARAGSAPLVPLPGPASRPAPGACVPWWRFSRWSGAGRRGSPAVPGRVTSATTAAPSTTSARRYRPASHTHPFGCEHGGAAPRRSGPGGTVGPPPDPPCRRRLSCYPATHSVKIDAGRASRSECSSEGASSSPWRRLTRFSHRESTVHGNLAAGSRASDGPAGICLCR